MGTSAGANINKAPYNVLVARFCVLQFKIIYNIIKQSCLGLIKYEDFS